MSDDYVKLDELARAYHAYRVATLGHLNDTAEALLAACKALGFDSLKDFVPGGGCRTWAERLLRERAL